MTVEHHLPSKRPAGSCASTVNAVALVVVWPALFVQEIVRVLTPVAVGAPVMSPVEASKERPCGSPLTDRIFGIMTPASHSP